jgi:colanic acid/amylovoran biosynthesis protein
MVQREFRACILGASLETGNRGVSALAASLAGLITEIRPGARIRFLVGNRVPTTRKIETASKKVETKVVNYRLSPKAKFHEHLFWIFLAAVVHRISPKPFFRELVLRTFPWLYELDKADYVGNIHGGDSFSDIYGLSNFIVGVIPDFITLIMNKRLVLFPQTYGPYSRKVSRFLARLIFNRAVLIISRDKEGPQVVQKIQGNRFDSNKVLFCPDVAFTLIAQKVKNPEIDPPLDIQLSRPVIGVNVNGLMYNGGYTRGNMFGLKCDYRKFVRLLIERLLKETSADVLLLPHTFGLPGNINSDPDACFDIIKSFRGKWSDRLHMLVKEYDQSEIKGIIGECAFFIGSRMHACIAAISQGIPTIAVAYSRKFIGVFESVGLGEFVVDLRDNDEEIAVNRVYAKYYSMPKNDKMELIEKAKNSVYKTLRIVIEDGKTI